MTDPMEALKSFQDELSARRLRLQQGALDKNLCVLLDKPQGVARFTYVRVTGQTATALAMFVLDQPIDQLPCFNVGYAVPIGYRGQGRAKDVLLSAIAELRHGLSRNGIVTFHIEAVVGADNQASQRVAHHVISSNPKSVTDSVSGMAALHYVRKVE